MITMKHARDNEDSSFTLLGSDHSKHKRQRTSSDVSDSSSVENKSCKSNENKHVITDKSKSDVSTARDHSPRMMALLSSLEVLDDNEAKKLQNKWPQTSSPTPTTPSLVPGTSPKAMTSTYQQKQNASCTRVYQPLMPRPTVHKIMERAPLQDDSGTSSSAPTAAPSPETIQTIKNAVSSATSSVTHESSVAAIVAMNAAIEKHRASLAAASAVVKAGLPVIQKRPTQLTSATFHQQQQYQITKTAPVSAFAPASNTLVLPRGPTSSALDAFRFPVISKTMPAIKNTRYDAASLLKHRTVLPPFPTQASTARQVAIHKAVHSDYKKIYRPLERPPRLPTSHEALVIAAISTARPSCR